MEWDMLLLIVGAKCGLLLHRGTKGTSTAFHLVCCTTVLLAGLKFSTFVAVVFF